MCPLGIQLKDYFYLFGVVGRGGGFGRGFPSGRAGRARSAGAGVGGLLGCDAGFLFILAPGILLEKILV